ncbi:polysaccharide deacetylase [Rhizobium sp. Root274]|uniref:polysaccharide deacetylase family protein n=1 Tax=unclassified Rhizobium TaxID=2613769 RepID=UPI0007124DCB|nr:MULTISPECIES: polysaccharide deacetylase family protein [unclassified Rhizobium]KQW32222.1 polysaccharide deacetylase [Rhizobium sp. Root1240]KRD33763.1 polysaccharide deacetylase [Rhizobium sp. Root274]
MSEALLRNAMDTVGAQGHKVRLWLRDDDSVDPTEALDRLLELTHEYMVPVTLAVIPKDTGEPLVRRLDKAPHARVALHGWSHHNHAPAAEKKQEIGLHRAAPVVLAELKQGFDKLAAIHAARFIPMLVPPWNRIAPALLPELPALGLKLLSVFGKEQSSSPIPLVNTHVDIMDWHGSGGGRPADTLFAELAGWVGRADAPPMIGILTHHLVHDAAAWSFLEALLAITASHPACEWVSPEV